MAESTGPVVATALITYGNSVIFHERDPFVESRILIAGAVAAGALYLVEQWSPRVARAFAWWVLIGALIVRVSPGVPSPLESLLAWWQQGQQAK